jgi:hypothetical protein
MFAIAALFVVKPIRDTLQNMDRRLAEDAMVINRLMAGSESIESYGDALEAVEVAVRSDPRYLVADSPALASASLQQIIRQALEGAGATLRSIQEVPAETRDSGRGDMFAGTSVTVRATVLATYPDILAALGVLEASRPYLFVNRLNIRSALRDENATEWSQLTVQFDVTAFMPPVVTLSQ